MGTMYAQGSDVGEFPNSTSSDNSTEFSRSGSTVTSTTNNTSDTASSDASNTIRVEGASAGDPYQKYQVGAVTSFAAGIDNDDDDLYKINIDTSGSVTPSTGTNLFNMSVDLAIYDLDRLSVRHERIGNVVQNEVNNTATTDADSAARLVCRTESETADAYTLFDVSFGASPGAHSWKVGSNGGNDGSFEFRNFVNGATPSMDGTLRQNITQDGEVTFPSTPSFLAQTDPGSVQNNVTGDGTGYTILFPTEIYDVNADYSSPDFTAPVTGKYYLFASVRVNSLTDAATEGFLTINTSNRSYGLFAGNMGNMRNSGNYAVPLATCVVDMDAGDTADVTITVVGIGADTVDIGVTNTNNCRFGGFLMG